jgi:N5-(carboxyethyl)ornithine synthase
VIIKEKDTKTIGFPRPVRKDEKRISLIPEDIRGILYPELIFLEKNYGADLNISDNEFKEKGVNIVSQEEVYQQSVIIQPKKCAEEFPRFMNGQTLIGWLYA